MERSAVDDDALLDAGTPFVERFTPAFIDSQRSVIRTLVERAVHRGELAELPDLDLLHALLGGTAPSWLHILRNDPHGLPEKLAGLVCAALGHA
ncbi:hypothetical protein [Streptomyces spectabilis]|uniref:Tetracyclin repressor-like C-terminal domain-containing protein n=1 Tax=Streptomyces spectabilis TaxID=68270 RepID=A0A516R1N1_STRST|nr:hypothetical protein [Streptomyces spectabilis]QDQ09530.1 hypothetical protein FH965_02275 [Streptomyces spectabilis]